MGGDVSVCRHLWGLAYLTGSERQLPTILILGTTQALAWASSYYLPAVLADPIARDLAISPNWVFGIFSVTLLISAFISPRVGRQMDARGGNGTLAPSSAKATA